MRCALTTKENEFNPFKDFIKWYFRDIDICSQYGIRDCSSIIDISLVDTEELSEIEYQQEKERVIDELISNDILGIYKKVYDDSN